MLSVKTQQKSADRFDLIERDRLNSIRQRRRRSLGICPEVALAVGTKFRLLEDFKLVKER
jgi:hypothetical protein